MKRMFLPVVLCLFVVLTNGQDLRVANPRCEYSVNPVGVEDEHPVFSWEIQSNKKNILQAAYRILVASDSSLLAKGVADVWDSKKINDGSNVGVTYKGESLKPGTKYYWKVMVWDTERTASDYSPIASCQMGLLQEKDWKGAEWIAYDTIPADSIFVPMAHSNGKKEWGKRGDVLPLFRKPFEIAKTVARATAFASGLGHFEMSVNGRKVGDQFLAPGWTQYAKQAQYVTLDITSHLQTGKNTVGAILGNGFYYIPGERYRKMTGAYGYPKFICLLKIEYEDGTQEHIITDGSWKTSPSPIWFSSIYGGEDYNAGREQKGWNTAVFDDASWKNAIITTGPELVAQKGEPVKVMQKFSPVRQIKIRTGEWVYDLGQNFSGIPAIEVRGKKGDTIRVFPGELLSDSNTISQKFTGRPHYYTYVLKGEGKEVWQPRFSYYGFRYLQVYGAEPIEISNSKLPVLEKIEGWHVRNSTPSAGTFSCSSSLFNNIHSLILWAINSNMVSVFTDCPHREKLGWQEQVHLMGNAIQFNYDITSFGHKIMRDIRAQQQANGLVPSTIPEFTEMHFADGYFRDSPEWGSTTIIFPWYAYKWSGDKEILAENYESMQKYFKYLQSKDSSYTLNYGLSDWYDLGPQRPGFSQLTPMGLTATAYYFYDAAILAKVAGALNKKEDSVHYQQVADRINVAFNERFFHESTMQYGSGSQTSNAIALYMGLVHPENKKAVFENLIADIRARNNSFTTGDIGNRYMLKVLEEAGRSDIIYDMHSRTDVPGYGYQLKQGATALTESWQALPTVSNNHFMLGHLMEWFYTGLCGINQKEGSTGFRNIVIKPQPVGDIREAQASYHSVNGFIEVSWKKREEFFTLDVKIPPNSEAVIYFPEEYNQKPQKIGSGTHHFAVKK